MQAAGWYVELFFSFVVLFWNLVLQVPAASCRFHSQAGIIYIILMSAWCFCSLSSERINVLLLDTMCDKTDTLSVFFRPVISSITE